MVRPFIVPHLKEVEKDEAGDENLRSSCPVSGSCLLYGKGFYHTMGLVFGTDGSAQAYVSLRRGCGPNGQSLLSNRLQKTMGHKRRQRFLGGYSEPFRFSYCSAHPRVDRPSFSLEIKEFAPNFYNRFLAIIGASLNQILCLLSSLYLIQFV
jgi:hypothetical protein